MKSVVKMTLVACLLMSATFGFTQTGTTEKTVMVGGAAMYPSKNIVENAVNSKDHTTLVAAVKAAGLVEHLPAQVLSPYLLQQTQLSTCYQKELLKHWLNLKIRQR